MECSLLCKFCICYFLQLLSLGHKWPKQWLVEKPGVPVQRRKVSIFMKIISPAPRPLFRRDSQSRHPCGQSWLMQSWLLAWIFQPVAWQVWDGGLTPSCGIRDAYLFSVVQQSSFGFSLLRFFQSKITVLALAHAFKTWTLELLIGK